MKENTFSQIRVVLFVGGIFILFAVVRKLVYSNNNGQDW